MVQQAALIACQTLSEYRVMLGAALTIGVTPVEVKEIVYQAVAPVPGTKRVARVEENTAADAIQLSPEQIDKLNHFTPAGGDHHNEEQMQMIER